MVAEAEGTEEPTPEPEPEPEPEPTPHTHTYEFVGWEIDLELTIAALEKEPGDAAVVEEKVDEILENVTVYYLSIDISVIVTDENGDELFTDTITESNAMIEFTVVIPEELLEAEGDTYTVLRIHDGEITALETTVNEDGTLTFASDMFSTYAIVKGYAIEEEPDEGEQPGGSDAGSGDDEEEPSGDTGCDEQQGDDDQSAGSADESAESTDSVSMADTMTHYLYLVLVLVAGAAAVTVTMRRRTVRK